MDALTFLVACIVGCITGLLPGLHVNTIAALALTVAAMDPGLAMGLIVVGTVHTVVSILPATYLGAPGDDTAIASLPAHRMLQAGRAPEAVRLSVTASTMAMIAVVALLLPVKWLLAAPLHGAQWLERLLPVVLIVVLAVLVLQERHRGWRGMLAAASIMLLAGWLGHLAWHWPVHNPWAPASALLPLLTGLYAAPTLLHAGDHAPPSQAPPPPRVPVGTWRQALAGTGVAAGTAVLPGLTAAVATALARVGRGDGPRSVIATLSAVNTAHHGFALAMLWLVGSTRSGLADAVAPAFRVRSWNGMIPMDLHAVLWIALAATVVGAVGTLAMEPLMRRVVHLPQRALHRGALVFLAATALALTGPWGLLLFAASAIVGELPLAFGVRRVHLAACLILPVLATQI